LVDTVLSRDRVVLEVYGAAVVEPLLDAFGVVEPLMASVGTPVEALAVEV
jgi:hypothetical protein